VWNSKNLTDENENFDNLKFFLQEGTCVNSRIIKHAIQSGIEIYPNIGIYRYYKRL
jgi:hypothetical protein